MTHRGNDWADKYPAIAKSIAGLPAQNANLDGELCGVLPDGRTAFNLIQNATDTGEGSLVFFLFDLLFLDGTHSFCGTYSRKFSALGVGWPKIRRAPPTERRTPA